MVVKAMWPLNSPEFTSGSSRVGKC